MSIKGSGEPISSLARSMNVSTHPHASEVPHGWTVTTRHGQLHALMDTEETFVTLVFTMTVLCTPESISTNAFSALQTIPSIF